MASPQETIPAAIDTASEFMSTLSGADPFQVTACAGWTVHDITAHLAAGSQEIADLIEEHLAGRPPRPTRGFAEREAPYRALAPETLRARFSEQVDRAVNARGLLAELPDRTVRFTGRSMTAAEFATHSRSERALHRWDIVGRDDV